MSKRPVDRIDTRPTGMLGQELQYLIIKAAGEAFWHDKQPLYGAILIIAPIEYFYWHDKASIVPAHSRRSSRQTEWGSSCIAGATPGGPRRDRYAHQVDGIDELHEIDDTSRNGSHR